MVNTHSAQATSLVKALHVLLALEDAPEGRGVTDIAHTLNMPKSAVHRLLSTFQEHGFVQQQAHNRLYRLGPALARLGLRAADRFAPRFIARPYLEALAQEVGETVFLGVLVPDGVLIVDKVEQAQVLRIAPALGTVMPLRQTALGMILLAFCTPRMRVQLLSTSQEIAASSVETTRHIDIEPELDVILRQGYAVRIGTWMPDVCCVAAPVRNGRGEAIAALSVALPHSRMPQPRRHDPFADGVAVEAYPTLVPLVVKAAAGISAALP